MKVTMKTPGLKMKMIKKTKTANHTKIKKTSKWSRKMMKQWMKKLMKRTIKRVKLIKIKKNGSQITINRLMRATQRISSQWTKKYRRKTLIWLKLKNQNWSPTNLKTKRNQTTYKVKIAWKTIIVIMNPTKILMDSSMLMRSATTAWGRANLNTLKENKKRKDSSKKKKKSTPIRRRGPKCLLPTRKN